jgi:hypothetical protein
MLVFIQIPVDINIEIELYLILHFDHTQLFIIVRTLNVKEQILRLAGNPHIFIGQLPLMLNFEVKLFIQCLIKILMHRIK